MSNLIHLICDYGPGDMAWSEVLSAFRRCLPPQTHTHLTSVRPFDTIATGFILAQLSMADENLRPKDLMVFANTAPRKDNLKARVNNAGEGLLFLTLKNGVQCVVVNSGFSLSFVKEHIQELWSTKCEDAGSQFRSRDFFPPIVGMAVAGDYSFLDQKLDPLTAIEDPPSHVIGYIDSFGNIKTTIRQNDPKISDLRPGDRVRVRIGGFVRTATVATGSFNIMEGDLAFAPGSSGQSNRFWEIFQRGGSAATEFGQPTTGSSIHIQAT
jgi:S-adenosylmethionine hydrolase